MTKINEEVFFKTNILKWQSAGQIWPNWPNNHSKYIEIYWEVVYLAFGCLFVELSWIFHGLPRNIIENPCFKIRLCVPIIYQV